MSEPQLDILIDQTEEVSQKLDEIKNTIREIELPEIPEKVSVQEAEILIEKIQSVVDVIQKIKIPEQNKIDLSPLINLLKQIKDKKIDFNLKDVLSSLEKIKNSIPEINTSNLEKFLKEIVSSIQKIKLPEGKDYTDDLKKIERAIKNISISYTGPSSVGIRNSGDTRINPATEETIVDIKNRLPNSLTSSGNLKVAIMEGGGGGGFEVVGIKDTSDIRINPAKEDGNLASIKSNTDKLDANLSTRATEATLSQVKQNTDRIPTSPATENGNLNDLLQLLKMLIQSPLGRLAIDNANRLRVAVDSSVAISATQSGTWNLGNFPVDQRWEMIQRANIEFNECQRSKFTFI